MRHMIRQNPHIPQGYKSSPLGIIPEDWEVKKLGNVASINRGGSPRPIEQYLTKGEGFNWIKIGDVGINAKYITSTEEKIIKEGLSKSRFVKSGDFILSNSMSFGRPYILKIDGCIHDGWLVIQEYDKTFNIDFLYYILGYDSTLAQYKSMAAGSGVLNLNKEIVKDVLLKIPPFPEQQRIVSVLSLWDTAIEKQTALIEKLTLRKRGLMQQLLTGKKRLKGFKGRWKEVRLGDVASINRGGSPRPIERYLTNGEGYNWIKIGDVGVNAKYITSTEEKIIKEGLSKTRFVKSGDFILSNSMSFGRPYILKIDGCIHDGWLVIQDYDKTFNIDFLYYILGYDTTLAQYKSMAAGSGVLNLNKDIVKEVLLKIPPIDEQKAIASILVNADKEIEIQKQKLTAMQEQKKGLMQVLLTGKRRVTI